MHSSISAHSCDPIPLWCCTRRAPILPYSWCRHRCEYQVYVIHNLCSQGSLDASANDGHRHCDGHALPFLCCFWVVILFLRLREQLYQQRKKKGLLPGFPVYTRNAILEIGAVSGSHHHAPAHVYGWSQALQTELRRAQTPSAQARVDRLPSSHHQVTFS